jgi:hypothetical protein
VLSWSAGLVLFCLKNKIPSLKMVRGLVVFKFE